MSSNSLWLRLRRVRATNAYHRAYAIAEEHGLADQIATASLNQGTAHHQLGEWGRALECYEGGLRLALDVGQRSTAMVLRLNLAQLYVDIGCFERAWPLLARLVSDAEENSLPALAASAASLRAQLYLAGYSPAEEDEDTPRDGPPARRARLLVGRAREALRQAREGYQQLGARRELVEIALEEAEVNLEEGEFHVALDVVDQARREALQLEAEDLVLRAALHRGQALLGLGQGPDALALLEETQRLMESLEQTPMVARAEMVLSKANDACGAPSLAQRHQRQALEMWERIAAQLPAPLRDAFWSHPLRRGSVPDAPAAEPFSPRLEQVLEINRRLNSSLQVDDVLRFTMDAAIELTGAERGFVIVQRPSPRGEPELYVPVARNIDREQVGKPRFKFSHTIATQVVRLGEPLVTVDAAADERFRDHQSVHAMALRSVLCVPIRSAHGTLGALYLDNRFQRGRFQEEHLPLLLAFSDQVALALRNAQLVERLEERTRQLEQRTRELEVEKRRAQALVRSQAEELDGLQQELRSRGQDRQSRYDYHAIVGRSPAMAALFLRLDRIVETALPVLVQGDSGTGKELVAHAIHSQGPRHDQPFVAVNCAALPEQLLESELFGYVKGAFTGAGQDRQGRFIEADGGTLFLDEIGELPWSVQAKLLRVLEDGKVRPLGSNRDRPVDVRLVSATNRRLRDEAQRGNFREDLFFRIAVMEVTLPSLTERIEDLPLLASHFLKQLGDELGRPGLRLRPGALRKLARFGWPGNIRQLRNVLARAAVLAQGNLLVPYLRFSAQIGHKSDRRLNVRRGP